MAGLLARLPQCSNLLYLAFVPCLILDKGADPLKAEYIGDHGSPMSNAILELMDDYTLVRSYVSSKLIEIRLPDYPYAKQLIIVRANTPTKSIMSI